MVLHRRSYVGVVLALCALFAFTGASGRYRDIVFETPDLGVDGPIVHAYDYRAD
jgi:hypothetical protein